MEPIKQKTDQLKTCLNEAVDLLDDIKDKLGMFQTQRYYRLKKDVEQLGHKGEENHNVMPDLFRHTIR